MAIEFAPRSLPLERRLQTAAVLQWVYSFLALAQTCIILFFALLFTRFWIISVLYGIWWFIDWDTPSQGGRRSHFLQSHAVWRYLRDYFPIKVLCERDSMSRLIPWVLSAWGPDSRKAVQLKLQSTRIQRSLIRQIFKEITLSEDPQKRSTMGSARTWKEGEN